MAAADPDLDMMVIERCIATLKSSSNFQEVMDVATIMMNLRKTSTRNTKEDFVALVNDVATRAITKAEKLKAARPASELTAEEKEARRAAVARAYQKRHGVLGGGKVKKGGADSLARMSSRERRIAAAAGGGGGGGGGGGTPMSAYAGRRRGGAASAAAAEDPRQSYYERLTKQGNLAKQISVQCHGRRRIDGTLPQFEDPLFGADERSIVGAPGALAGDAARGAAPKGPPIVAWKRPKELAHRWGCKPQLFLDGADPGDVEQGALGDCWLLGAFSIVAAHGTSRLRRLVVHSDFESGVHAFTFYRNREWTKVVVDDRLPVSAGDRLVFARCKNPGEFWVPLLEKAYAKLNGSYASIEAGIEGDALVDMTGGASKIIRFDPNHTSAQRAQVWEMLRQYQQRGSMMGCASNGESPAVAREATRLGLVLNHAYGILLVWEGVRQDGSKVKLLKLRNPWGEREWQGKWRSSDRERWSTLSPALRQQLGHSEQNDGTFFMDFETFYLVYEKIYLCKMFPKSWHSCQLPPMQWVGRSAGGCSNHPTWVNNPQVQLIVRQTTKIFIVLNRNEGQRIQNYQSIGIALYRNGVTGRRMLIENRADLLNSMQFVNARERTMELTVPASERPYVLLPQMYDPGPACGGPTTDKQGKPFKAEGSFKISVSSEHAVQLVAVTPSTDWKEQGLEARWVAGCAGGCRNHPHSWRENPTFGLETYEAQHVEIRISQQWQEGGSPAIGFYVLLGEEEVGSTSTWRASEGNVLALDLPATEAARGPYSIVATTFDPNTFSAFTLTVYSTSGAFRLTRR